MSYILKELVSNTLPATTTNRRGEEGDDKGVKQMLKLEVF